MSSQALHRQQQSNNDNDNKTKLDQNENSDEDDIIGGSSPSTGLLHNDKKQNLGHLIDVEGEDDDDDDDEDDEERILDQRKLYKEYEEDFNLRRNRVLYQCWQLAASIVTPESLAVNDTVKRLITKEQFRYVAPRRKILRPGDLITVRTPGTFYKAFRTFTDHQADHLGVVLDNYMFLHIGPPSIRLLPVEILLAPNRLPKVYRPKLNEEERQLFLDKLRPLVGKDYDILRVYSFVGRLGLKTYLGFNQPLMPANKEKLYICTDAIMSRLIQSSASFRKATNKRINFDYTDLKSWSINDIEKFHRFFPTLLPLVPLPLLSPLKPFDGKSKEWSPTPFAALSASITNRVPTPTVPLWAYFHRFQRRLLLIWERIIQNETVIATNLLEKKNRLDIYGRISRDPDESSYSSHPPSIHYQPVPPPSSSSSPSSISQPASTLNLTPVTLSPEYFGPEENNEEDTKEQRAQSRRRRRRRSKPQRSTLKLSEETKHLLRPFLLKSFLEIFVLTYRRLPRQVAPLAKVVAFVLFFNTMKEFYEKMPHTFNSTRKQKEEPDRQEGIEGDEESGRKPESSTSPSHNVQAVNKEMSSSTPSSPPRSKL